MLVAARRDDVEVDDFVLDLDLDDLAGATNLVASAERMAEASEVLVVSGDVGALLTVEDVAFPLAFSVVDG